MGIGMAQGPINSILVTTRITVWVQKSEVRNPHSLYYRKSDPHHYRDPVLTFKYYLRYKTTMQCHV